MAENVPPPAAAAAPAPGTPPAAGAAPAPGTPPAPGAASAPGTPPAPAPGSPPVILVDTDAEPETEPETEPEPEPDGTSHTETPTQVFEPVPYIFVLKDLYGNPMHLPSNEASNAQISCPPFYTLLDHVIGVLWIVYSGKRSSVLRSSHIHWALKFLEGMKDKHNRYSPDVEMAINQLGELLIDICGNIDEEGLQTSPPLPLESTRTEKVKDSSSKSPGYNAFLNPTEVQLNEAVSDINTSLKAQQNAAYEAPCKELPSLLLDNMVENDDCIRVNIERTINDAVEHLDEEVPEGNVDNDRVISKATKWKEEQTNAAVAMLNRMKTINDLLHSLRPEVIDPSKIQEIEDFIKLNSSLPLEKEQ